MADRATGELTVEEAAQEAGCWPSNIYNALKKGKLTFRVEHEGMRLIYLISRDSWNAWRDTPEVKAAAKRKAKRREAQQKRRMDGWGRQPDLALAG